MQAYCLYFEDGRNPLLAKFDGATHCGCSVKENGTPISGANVIALDGTQLDLS